MTAKPAILNARVPAEYAEWLRLWERSPGREPWWHPGYALLFTADSDECLCATVSTSDGGLLLPMILRPISAEAWAEPNVGWDMTSPYGYGGARAWGAPHALGDEFWPWLEATLVTRRVVTWFCRLSLFPEQILPGMPGVSFDRNNVVRTTAVPLDAIWADYAHKVRKNVKRARGAGLQCVIDDIGTGLDDFLDIYYRTLRRRDAAAFYYFGRSFFLRLLESLRGRYAFFHIRNGRDVLASELVLTSEDYVYSFLGGTSDAHLELRPNDLLKHCVIEWAHDTGRKAFVLGGGAVAKDGVLRYKLSFAPGGEVPFFASRYVLDQAAVDDLASRRAAAALAQGEQWAPREGFFPPYRA